MRSLMALLGLLLLSQVQASTTGWQDAKHLRAELVSEYQQVSPGQTLTLALHFIPDPHWHTYWQNPGDSGLATSLDWQLPAGVSAGEIQWPTPQAFVIAPLVNYGFDGDTVLLVDVQIAEDYAQTSVPIAVKADWLVCEEICIPAEASFNLTLPVGEAVLATEQQRLFSDARQRLPKPLNVEGYFDTSAGAFSAVITLDTPRQVDAFFVAGTELVDHAGAQQILLQGKQLLLQQPLNTYFSAAPAQTELVLTGTDGAYSVMLQHNSSQDAAAPLELDIRHGQQSDTSLWLILLMALAGGLILNLMPCVFPVLSLKAMSLAATGGAAAQTRLEALWYCAGVVVSFSAMAMLLIGLRAAGDAVGWGFQLQQPFVVALLVYLLFALGLSLSGVVQFGLGLMNTGNNLAGAGGSKGAFFTGVLAVVVASPCTAPFMGPALGYAVTQQALVALLVFIALGLGMALPFLLLALFPALAARLPKPGAWMDTLKQWLAYPLYLSAVWLLWVYGRQSGVNAQALLLVGLVCIAAVCWLWGRRQQGTLSGFGSVLALLLLIAALVLPLLLQPAAKTGSQSNSAAAQDNAIAFNAGQLKQLRAEGKPVLVNMTADWCITCLVNERVALNTDSSRAALALYDVTYMKGDWTLRDSAITDYLRLYQRDGVPLYVLYWPGQPPEVLPQILTPQTLPQTLERLSRQP